MSDLPTTDLTATAIPTDRTAVVLDEVAEELRRAETKFPDQHLPDGTGRPGERAAADLARRTMDAALAAGKGTWRQVLDEEVREAFAETDPKALRAELVQVAAMATRWINDIDRRTVAA